MYKCINVKLDVTGRNRSARVDAVIFTFIFARFDEGDLGWAWGQVGGHRVAVRAWGQTPLSGAAALSVSVPPPAQPVTPAASPACASASAVGTRPAPCAPGLVDLIFVAVVVVVVLRHGLALARPAHGHLNLPLSPDGLKDMSDIIYRYKIL